MRSNIILGGGIALLFLVLGWLRGSRNSAGFGFRSMTIRLLVYGLGLVVGEAYLMVLFADLKWPRVLLFLAITSWGVLLGAGVWHRRLGTSESRVVQK